MADSNSKKPMALLLLVVVAVLVVIMVSGGDAAFEGHAKIADKDGCVAAKGDWKKAMVAVDTWKAADGTEATCTEAGGTFTDKVEEVKDASGEVTTAAADATCMKEAEAETCHEPVWANLTTKEDCDAANGTFTDEVKADDKADPPVEGKAASCEPWKATDDTASSDAK